jgi:cadmium resistance protein CadD (predicted permease)
MTNKFSLTPTQNKLYFPLFFANNFTTTIFFIIMIIYPIIFNKILASNSPVMSLLNKFANKQFAKIFKSPKNKKINQMVIFKQI